VLGEDIDQSATGEDIDQSALSKGSFRIRSASLPEKRKDGCASKKIVASIHQTVFLEGFVTD
jgi:hypothetical protein